MPETPEALQRAVVALLVGLLIGLDRERAEDRKRHKLFGGVRTFPLIALLGASFALVRPELGVGLLVFGFVAVAGVVLIAYRSGTTAGEIGATTEITALVTYALGAIAGDGHLVVAAAIGVAVAVLLALKFPLEGLSRAMSEQELTAVLELAVISAIILPLLPDRGYGPWQVWNPYRIWLVVVLVSAVSFAGFVAVRWKGEKAGLYWAAVLGALVSSTATTAAMAERSRDAPALAGRVAAAAVFASVVMCARVLVLVGAVRPALLVQLAPPIAAMAVVGGLAGFLLHRSSRGAGRGNAAAGPAKMRTVLNPFSLWSAVVFALVFAATLLLVKASEAWLGAPGTLLAAVLAGLVDIDAISLAVSRDASLDAPARAVLPIVAACGSNNVFKTGVAVVAGGGRFRRDVALVLLAMGAAGIGLAVLLARL